jgi:hypothetical protein
MFVDAYSNNGFLASSLDNLFFNIDVLNAGESF